MARDRFRMNRQGAARFSENSPSASRVLSPTSLMFPKRHSRDTPLPQNWTQMHTGTNGRENRPELIHINESLAPPRDKWRRSGGDSRAGNGPGVFYRLTSAD